MPTVLTVVPQESLGVSLTVDLITQNDAQWCYTHDLTVFWLRQWPSSNLWGEPVTLSAMSTNVAGKLNGLPGRDIVLPSFPVESRLTAPRTGEEGWWFGKPTKLSEQVPGTMKWWDFLGKNDGTRQELHVGLRRYRGLLASGHREYDWVDNPEALMEYAAGWAFGRFFQMNLMHDRAIEVNGIAIEASIFDYDVKALLMIAILKGLEPRLYSTR